MGACETKQQYKDNWEQMDLLTQMQLIGALQGVRQDWWPKGFAKKLELTILRLSV